MKLLRLSHVSTNKHKARMIEAELGVFKAYALRDNGDPLAGWNAMGQATKALADCGCPSELWPEKVREAIPV